MLKYSYNEIAKAVRGKLIAKSRRKLFRGHVSLDTRTLKDGDLYIPLKGRNYDGHRFIDEAFKKGSRLVLCEIESGRFVERRQGDVIFVDNTLQALGRLAAFHRRHFKIPVVAITGSCGKTTTKDIVAHILAKKKNVLKSYGNENNYVGVPKTLLKLQDQDVAVIEIGTNRTGEVRYLSRITNPTHGILTLIGNAHLSGFRNVQGVRSEKLSLVESMEERTTFIYNGDDANIVHKRIKRLKPVRVGLKKGNSLRATNLQFREGETEFILNVARNRYAVKTHLLGHHNVMNALLAIGVALQLGVKIQLIIDALEDFEAPRGRVRYQAINGIHWIDDSYNSNPSSLQAAIELFKVYPPKGRKILVLGDMLELGPRASLFHREAGLSISKTVFDFVITVGDLSKEITLGAVKRGFKRSQVKSFKTSDEAAPFVAKMLKSHDTILLKGSRGMHMELIMDYCSKGPQRKPPRNV